MPLRLGLLRLLLILMLMVSLPQFRSKQAVSCSIRFTSVNPSSISPATKPGEKIINFKFDLSSTDIANTDLSVQVSAKNMNVISSSIIKSTRSGSVRVYIHYEPSEYASLSITIKCNVNGYSDSDTKNLGKAYIVAIPDRWTPSISPTQIHKRDEIELRVNGLSDIDDSVGTLNVYAEIGGSRYNLNKVSKGVYSRRVNLNLVDKPAGQLNVKFTVYKVYAGVSAIDHESKAVTILGSPPEISGDVPSSLHRGDRLTINVEESDGDSVSAVAQFFGDKVNLNVGSNSLTVPRDIRAGNYRISATASDVDGTTSESWSIEVINEPPSISMAVSSDKVPSGGEVVISVSASDDSEGLKVTLTIEGQEVHKQFQLSSNGGEISYTVPDNLRGTLNIRAEAVDLDGATSSLEKMIRVGMPPKIVGEIPASAHRKDSLTLEVFGDEVSGYIEFAGQRTQILGEGKYTLSIPDNIKEGNYVIHAHASSDYGVCDVSWRVFVENIPPEIDMDVSSTSIYPGDILRITINAHDDSPGLSIIVKVNDKTYTLNEGGIISYQVSSGISEISIIAKATDIDGAQAQASKVVKVKSVDTSTTPESTTTSTGTSISNHSAPVPSQKSGSEGSIYMSNTTDSEELQRSCTSSHNRSLSIETPNLSNKLEDMTSKADDRHDRLTVEVIPSETTVGNNVTVIVRSYGSIKGRVWITDPKGKEILKVYVHGVSEISKEIKVSIPGVWKVRWIYLGPKGMKSGEIPFKVLPEANTSNTKSKIAMGNLKRISSEKSTEFPTIRPFEGRCLTYRRGDTKTPELTVTVILMLTTLLSYFVIRRKLL